MSAVDHINEGEKSKGKAVLEELESKYVLQDSVAYEEMSNAPVSVLTYRVCVNHPDLEVRLTAADANRQISEITCQS